MQILKRGWKFGSAFPAFADFLGEKKGSWGTEMGAQKEGAPGRGNEEREGKSMRVSLFLFL